MTSIGVYAPSQYNQDGILEKVLDKNSFGTSIPHQKINSASNDKKNPVLASATPPPFFDSMHAFDTYDIPTREKILLPVRNQKFDF